MAEPTSPTTRNNSHRRPSGPRVPPESTNRNGVDLSCHDAGQSSGMTNEALLWNAPRPPARQPRLGKRVKSLWKDVRRIDCELRESEFGVEVQLLVNDGFYSGRRHASREGALQASTGIRDRLERSGWGQPVESSVACAGSM